MSKACLWGSAAVTVLLCAHEGQAQTAIPPSPKDFVMAATQSDHYEILAATVALAESQDSRTLSYAEEMIRDHRRLSDDLRRAAGRSGLAAPDTGMSSDQALLLSGLQSVRGSEFDKTYARQQELAHAQAVAVTESFALSGMDQNLQKSAQSALSTIRDHLTMAQQLRAVLDKP